LTDATFKTSADAVILAADTVAKIACDADKVAWDVACKAVAGTAKDRCVSDTKGWCQAEASDLETCKSDADCVVYAGAAVVTLKCCGAVEDDWKTWCDKTDGTAVKTAVSALPT